MKMVVIADEWTALAFALAGMETRVVSVGSEVPSVLDDLSGQDVGLVLITESLAEENREMIGEVLLHPRRPLILEIPGMVGPVMARAKAQDRILSLLRR